MEYMNRAERRRAKRQGEKVSKPPVYNYTPGTLRNQLDYEAKADVREKLKKVREEATADAINTAMMLLLTLPCNVLIDKYWKDEPEKVQDFLDTVLDQYTRWQNGELDINKLRADLWEIGGIRLEEKTVGYKNQKELDKINEKLRAIREDLEITRITAGGDKVIQSVTVMAVIYATLIIKGKKTFAEVPAVLKDKVKEILIDLELPELAE